MTFLAAHPLLAQFFHSPIPYLGLLVLGLTSLWAERQIKEPHIAARYGNFRSVPDLHSVTLQMVTDAEHKKPGWDKHRFDWDWFVEVQMVNDSETRTTFDHLKIEITLRQGWCRKPLDFTYLDDLDSFDMDLCLNGEGKDHGRPVQGERYRPVPSLVEKIKGVPLEQEIGYRGWVHFKVPNLSQREVNSEKIRINMWIVDAKQREHELHFRKKDKKSWDNSFFIGPKTSAPRNRKN